jgi:hypothetical protein
VAPEDIQLATNDTAVTELIVTKGGLGAGGRVVRLVLEEYVAPLEFIAEIISEYVVLGISPVKLADLLATPASVEGVTSCPLMEYVYDVALIAPVQVTLNEVSLSVFIDKIGTVGGKINVVALTELADILPVVFTAVTTKEYVVSGERDVKVAVLPTTLGVIGTVFSVNV